MISTTIPRTLAALVKHVPVGGGPLRVDDDRLAREGVSHGIDPINEVGLEWALRQREAGSADRVVAVCMGPPEAVTTLRRALAMGADEALHVTDPALAGADVRTTARTLAAAARRVGAGVLVFGNESADGSSGAVPSATAAVLGVPLVSRARTAVLADAVLVAERDLGRGPETVTVQGPVVVSFVEGGVEPRYPSLRDLVRTRTVPAPTLSAGDLGLDPSTLRSVANPADGATVRESPTPDRAPTVVPVSQAAEAILELLADAGALLPSRREGARA